MFEDGLGWRRNTSPAPGNSNVSTLYVTLIIFWREIGRPYPISRLTDTANCKETALCEPSLPQLSPWPLSFKHIFFVCPKPFIIVSLAILGLILLRSNIQLWNGFSTNFFQKDLIKLFL